MSSSRWHAFGLWAFRVPADGPDRRPRPMCAVAVCQPKGEALVIQKEYSPVDHQLHDLACALDAYFPAIDALFQNRLQSRSAIHSLVIDSDDSIPDS